MIAACNRLSEVRTAYGRDGADQMAAVVTQYRVVSALVPKPRVADDLFLRAVNFQAGLSYAVSGISKAFGSSWVQGDALAEVLQTENYGRGPAAPLLRRHPRLCRVLTVGTIVWEAGFPVIYALPDRWAVRALHAVKGFHVAVASVMELPRFVWGFTGSHGAVEYVLRTRGQERYLERAVLGAAAAVVAVSAVQAQERRNMDRERRLGLRGVQRTSGPHGTIEYTVDGPATDPGSTRPAYLLECGLGQPLESWAWIAEHLAKDHTVVRYHRPGYGMTESGPTVAATVATVLTSAGVTGPVIVVAHSIGSLVASLYVTEPELAGRVRALVIIDGTDPDLLEAERQDRRRLGKFIQTQAHSLFAGTTGIHSWAPNVVERQVAFAPDDQASYVQFVFAPRTVVNAVREYLTIDLVRARLRARDLPPTLVIASSEHAEQQAEYAAKISADLRGVPGASHRSILGFREHAGVVAAQIREFSDAH